ncbi:hypothetical protein Y046_4934 [Burkholderia pseudomallei MSHR2990]|nr:hypothetical protein Y046_4934 [Burkholderia pseudomallei MSHR2990]
MLFSLRREWCGPLDKGCSGTAINDHRAETMPGRIVSRECGVFCGRCDCVAPVIVFIQKRISTVLVDGHGGLLTLG